MCEKTMTREDLQVALTKQIRLLEQVNGELKENPERNAAEIRNNALTIKGLVEALYHIL